MRRIVTEIEIRASPVSIWSILTDFSSYPDWNPFIREIAGAPIKGARLKISVKPPNGRAMTFRPVVVESIENRELRWRGRLPVPGLFDGEHFFRIEAVNPVRSRFIQGEYFSGILARLFGPSLATGTRAGFIEMNQALKSKAEHA